jgi:opacity protein-like surface antigen
MKAFTLVVLLAVAALLAGTSTAVVRAQGAPAQAAPEPSQTPMDPHLYIDPGLEFTAPPEAYLAGRRIVPVAALGEDLAPVAIWAIYPGKPEVRLLRIEMESFPNNPAQWEGQFESQMHGAKDGVLIKRKTPMTLTNGMPAQFVEITYGNGFDAKKEYAVVYADGSRGVVISVTGRIGEATAEEAQRWMANAKAVRYPLDREPPPQ